MKQTKIVFIFLLTLHIVDAFSIEVVERWRIHEITLNGTDKVNPFVETSLYCYFHMGSDTFCNQQI